MISGKRSSRSAYRKRSTRAPTQAAVRPSGLAHSSAVAVLEAAGVDSATLTESGINPPGANPYRLRRFLDGRLVSEAAFEAYLSGAQALFRTVKSLVTAEG